MRLYWVKGGPKFCSIRERRGRFGYRDTEEILEEGHVTAEAETRMIQLQVEECQGSLAAIRI